MADHVKKFLTKRDLDDIAQAIAEAEKRTSGEIRVAVRQKRSRKEKGLNVEQLARHEFAHLGMVKTQERTGILIFVLLEGREFHILADEHINQKVEPNSWQKVADAMSASFSKKQYRDGLITAVRTVGEHLATHFPVRAGDKNELSNKVEIS